MKILMMIIIMVLVSGGKIKSFGKKAIGFVKDNNLVSKGLSMAAPMLSNINPALGAVAGTAGNIAGNLGFSTKAF